MTSTAEATLGGWSQIFEEETLVDAAIINDIIDHRKDIQNICFEKQEDLKQIIADLSGHVSELKVQTSVVDDSLEKEKAQLDDEKSVLDSKVESFNSDIDSQKAVLEEMKQKSADYTKQKAEIETKAQNSLPSLENTLRLYKQATPITWDYKASTAKGTVHLTKQETLEPFDFKDKTPFEATNCIWDTLWKDHSSAAVAVWTTIWLFVVYVRHWDLRDG